MKGRDAAACRGPLSAILACVGTVLVVLATLVAVVETVAFNADFYQKEYAKLGTAAYVGVDGETLTKATDTLLAYLQGERDSLNMTAEIGGETREYYNDREKAHMADVAALNQNAVTAMAVWFPLGGALIVCGALLSRAKSKIAKACFFSIVGVLAAFAALAVFAALDFYTFWVSFHHVFFTNDLWMLDPRTSLLIRMYEEAFFFDLVGKILAWFLGITAAALVAAGLLWKRLENRCKNS